MNKELQAFISQECFHLGLNTAHDYEGVETETDLVIYTKAVVRKYKELLEQQKAYLQHLKTCNVFKDWSEADQALADTPTEFRDAGYYLALHELQTLKQQCTCGLDGLINKSHHH